MANGNPLGVQVARLEERVGVVEEGVANFRAFHKDVYEFIVRSDERAKSRQEKEQEDKEEAERKERQRDTRLNWFMTLVIGLIIAGFGVVLGWILNFESRHKVSQNQNVVEHSSVSTPTDATLPPTYIPK